MFFSKILSLTILVATAAADTHKSCTCTDGGDYNAVLTSAACSFYDAAEFQWGRSSYDAVRGRCSGTADGMIAGNEWEDECKTAAQHVSFTCSNGKGECYAKVDDVRGSC